MAFKAEDGIRPSPPKSVEEMTNTMSKRVVEYLLKVKAKEGNDESQRMYKEVSRFYVVANRYEKKDTCIGTHTDFKVRYAVPQKTPSGPQFQHCGRWGLVD